MLARLTSLRPEPAAVSFSYGWFEQNYTEAAGGNPAKAAAMIRAQAAGISYAARHGITVVSADGDTGSTGPDLAGTGVYSAPTVAFMASDLLVTAVSGTQISADDTGTRTAPDTVWSGSGDGGATGGGLSAVFGRPAYQDPYASIVGGQRGVGDVAMDASGQSQVWIYTSRYQLLPGQGTGWVRIAGHRSPRPCSLASSPSPTRQPDTRSAQSTPGCTPWPVTPAANGIQPVVTGCNTDYGVTGSRAQNGPGACLTGSAPSATQPCSSPPSPGGPLATADRRTRGPATAYLVVLRPAGAWLSGKQPNRKEGHGHYPRRDHHRYPSRA